MLYVLFILTIQTLWYLVSTIMKFALYLLLLLLLLPLFFLEEEEEEEEDFFFFFFPPSPVVDENRFLNAT